MDKDTAIRYLVDAQGRPQGVVLDEELWNQVCDHVHGVLRRLFPAEPVIAEPMADYDLLEKYWDFRYEMPTDVSCEVCGASTANWREDEPRKFMLRAANMGGLLAFQCEACKSRITKRHFKDKVTVTCTPHVARSCG